MIYENKKDKSDLRINRYEDIGSGRWGYQLIRTFFQGNGNGESIRVEESVREVSARIKDEHYILEDVTIVTRNDGAINEFAGSFRFIALNEPERADKEMLSRIKKEARVYANYKLDPEIEIKDNTQNKSERITKRIL